MANTFMNPQDDLVEEREQEKKPLDIEDGMLLDVIMKDEQVLCTGEVEDFDGAMLHLVDPNGGSMPPVTYGTELKLRCQLPNDQIKVYHGTVLGSRSSMWRVGELSDWYGWNRRSFYRQNLSIESRVLRTKRAHALSLQSLDVKVACRLLDVSAGGVLLACSQAVFELGDQLHVTDATLLPDEKPFSFMCVVKRIEKARFNNIYGCQFFGLDSREEDRIVRAVFQLQLLERREKANK